MKHAGWVTVVVMAVACREPARVEPPRRAEPAAPIVVADAGTGALGQLGLNTNSSPPTSGAREIDRGPRVTLGEGEAEGDVSFGDLDAVARVVRTNLASMRVCYDMARNRTPGLQGRGALRLTVGADGLATEVRFSGLGDDGLKACIEGRTQRFRFAPHGGGPLRCSFPLNFEPPEAG